MVRKRVLKITYGSLAQFVLTGMRNLTFRIAIADRSSVTGMEILNQDQLLVRFIVKISFYTENLIEISILISADVQQRSHNGIQDGNSG